MSRQSHSRSAAFVDIDEDDHTELAHGWRSFRPSTNNIVVTSLKRKKRARPWRENSDRHMHGHVMYLCLRWVVSELQTEVTTAVRVVEFMFDKGMAQVERPSDIRAWIEAQFYAPQYGARPTPVAHAASPDGPCLDASMWVGAGGTTPRRYDRLTGECSKQAARWYRDHAYDR
jgi:hypothetical protein